MLPVFVFCCFGNWLHAVGALFAPADGHGIRTRLVLHRFDWPTGGREHFDVTLFFVHIDDFDFHGRAVGKRAPQGANVVPKERAPFDAQGFCI